MKNSVFKNLDILITQKGTSRLELAAYLKCSVGAVGHWAHGRRHPPLKQIEKMATFFDTGSPQELLSVLKKIDEDYFHTLPIKKDFGKKFKIPEFAILDWDSIQKEENYLFGLIVTNAALTPPDNSLGIREGEIILIDTEIKAASGSYVLAQIGEGHILRKYIEDGSDKYLEALNPAYERKKVDEHVKIVGCVTMVLRKV